MPYPTKRQKQLQKAQNAKRQKIQDVDSQKEQQSKGDEQNEHGSLPSVSGESMQQNERELLPSGSSDSKDGASGEESDVSDIDCDELIEVYANEWIAGLDRDDLMSLTITLHHLLVFQLKLKVTDASKLIAELTGKGERNHSTLEGSVCG